MSNGLASANSCLFDFGVGLVGVGVGVGGRVSSMREVRGRGDQCMGGVDLIRGGLHVWLAFSPRCGTFCPEIL